MSRVRPRMIFLTSDGVRIDEFKGCHQLSAFSSSRKLFAQKGHIYGIDAPFIAPHQSWTSLPCYQTLLSGRIVAGQDNNIPRLPHPSFLDGGWLQGVDVAAVASWEKLEFAVSNQEHSFRRFCGPQDGDALPPWQECAFDRDTHRRGVELWDSGVDWLYVSYADTDDIAHTGDWQGYLDACRQYDRYLSEWYAKGAEHFSRTGEDVWIIATTDHGRGAGTLWTEHDGSHKHSQYIWAMLTSMKESLPRWNWQTHLDIVATLAASFDLRLSL